MYQIYALCDPQTHKVRYIGITKQLIRQRMALHRSSARHAQNKRPIDVWMLSLLQSHMEPCVAVLEVTSDCYKEQFWITLMRSCGCDLLNLSECCEGRSGVPLSQTARTRQKEAVTGKKQTPEHRAKIRAASEGRSYASGWKHSEEARKKISQRFSGKPKSEEHKRKLSEARKAMFAHAKSN